MRKSACAAAFAAAFFAGAASRLKLGPWRERKTPPGAVLERLDLPYGPGESQRFDLYLPRELNEKTYGLVVYLHAGGFTAGDKREDADILRRIAAKGFAAAGVNYTLRTDANPSASVASMSREVLSSVPAIAEYAAGLGVELDRMAIGGGSAGGCLALLYAYRDAAASPLPLRFVFEAVGPAGFEPADWFGAGADGEAAAAFVGLISGRELMSPGTEEYEAALRDVSAYMWVTPESAPTLCAYGERDRIVPYATAERLKAALEENRVPHDFISLPHSGHGLQNDAKLSRLYAEKLDEYLERYLA